MTSTEIYVVLSPTMTREYSRTEYDFIIPDIFIPCGEIYGVYSTRQRADMAVEDVVGHLERKFLRMGLPSDLSTKGVQWRRWMKVAWRRAVEVVVLQMWDYRKDQSVRPHEVTFEVIREKVMLWDLTESSRLKLQCATAGINQELLGAHPDKGFGYFATWWPMDYSEVVQMASL